VRQSVIVQVRAEDLRPPSLLGRRVVTGKMALGGVLFALGAHLLVPATIALMIAIIAATGVGATPTKVIPEDKVVEARFVRLGQKMDPKKLPNRKVPIKTTAPQPGVAVSKNMDPPKPKEQKPPPPQHAEENPLTHLGDRAQQFAEIQEKREQEGDPQGIAEGTETQAKAGDLYRGQLVAFFKRGWTIPSTLGDSSRLQTRASVEITPDRKVADHKIVKSSGDPLFDQSVEDRFNELRSLGTTLPDPPPEVADQFSGSWTLDVNFIGKKLD
jgi:outer membrane biosynthesis protein TonB